QQGADAHHQHGGDKRGAPAVTTGKPSEVPAADRPDQKADRIDSRDIQQLRGAISFRKEAGGEVQRRERVDVEIEPFDQIAGRAGGDGGKPLPMTEYETHGCADARAMPLESMSSISFAE